jgi:hypothetical protein
MTASVTTGRNTKQIRYSAVECLHSFPTSAQHFAMVCEKSGQWKMREGVDCHGPILSWIGITLTVFHRFLFFILIFSSARSTVTS